MNAPLFLTAVAAAIAVVIAVAIAFLIAVTCANNDSGTCSGLRDEQVAVALLEARHHGGTASCLGHPSLQATGSARCYVRDITKDYS